MFKKAIVASAVGIALAGGFVGAAQADVIAQSILTISGFTITPSNPAVIGTVAGSNQASASLSLNGGPTVADSDVVPFIGAVAAPVSAAVYQGTAGYTPYTPLLPLGASPTSTFGNASSDLTGSSLLPGGTDAKTDATVSIVGNGKGVASSNLGVTSTFTIAVLESSTLTFDFLGDPFLRSFVDPLFSAQAGLTWNLEISQEGTTRFLWAPNGDADSTDITGTVGGVEVYDPCSLNTGAGQTLAGENFYNPTCVNPAGSGGAVGQFRASTNTLAAGTYELRISHFSNASAISEAPEPSSLLLAGLALFGAGAISRRYARR